MARRLKSHLKHTKAPNGSHAARGFSFVEASKNWNERGKISKQGLLFQAGAVEKTNL